MNKIYNVTILLGQYEDIYEITVFTTFDENKAQSWVDRYNKIVRNYKN